MHARIQVGLDHLIALLDVHADNVHHHGSIKSSIIRSTLEAEQENIFFLYKYSIVTLALQWDALTPA